MLRIDLLTIAKEYVTLAGNGQNTIRLFDGKYLGMHPGDAVQMQYADHLESPTFSIYERLIISSMVIARLDILVKNHGENNHALWGLPPGDPEDDTLDSYEARGIALQKHIRSFYPGNKAALALDTAFVALYF